MDWKVLVGSKVLLLILLSTSVKSDGEKRVVCYYTNWSVYRPGTAKFSPQNINPYLCTHLIYAFGGFTKDNTLKPFDKYQDVDKGGYAKFTGLKTYNKDLKTLLAIGGWNEGSSRFSPMVADSQRRRQFVKNAVKFLRQNHFDGLDLDWEYPAFRDGGKPRDKDNYANLVKELREEFEKESSKTGRTRLLLTMAVPAGIEYIDKGYDIPKLNEYLDFINLLSYDYHSAYEPAVNHHSPLYPLEEDNEYNYDNELTIDYTIKHLIKSGASSDKIVVGIPTYGRSYTLFNEDATDLGAPADGPGVEGDATREKGYLAYYEICENIEKDDWIVEKPNPKAMGPYAYNQNQWVGYDDEDIVRAKAKYVNEQSLGGIMFWSIDNDDFRGKCHGRPYPLIEAAKEALLEGNGKQRVDNRPNSISTRKRNRVSETSKTNSQSNSRKSEGTSNRRNTLTRTTSGKRTAASSKSRSRTSSKSEEESNDENAENSENIETKSNQSTRPRVTNNKNRFRSRANNSDRNSKKKQGSVSATTPKPSSNKLTTPEPPTTPDPGSDFKCEDEGFFQHPRDCKKYFWCLDSGPSGLGIVANQFTCPSGLVFNKLADSCDYPRNVVCPKAKSQTAETTTTTQRTTTTTEKDEIIEEDDDIEDEEYEDEEDDVIEDKSIEEEKPKKITTTARPLLYKTINRTRPTTTSTTTTSTTTTTTTTTSAPLTTTGSARSIHDITDEEQDPKVIKELIDLIKKAGGIEQLEKQLSLQEKGSTGGLNQNNGQVTPATISKSLYDRVLNRQSTKSNLFRLPTTRVPSSTKKTIEVETEDDEEEEEELEEKIVKDKSASRLTFVNGPGRSQFEGLDEVPEVKGLRRSNKPKYVTIERHSSSTTSSKIDGDFNERDDDIDEEDDGEESEDNENVASSEEKLISNVPIEKNVSTQRSTPGYVNIRRTRPTTTTGSTRAENDIKEDDTIVKEEPGHNLRRTSFRTSSTQRETTEDVTTPKTRYINVNRFRSTTVTPQKENDQISTESTSAKPETTTQSYSESYVTDDKTITVAGESGRISITPFTTDTPSTARIFTDDSSSTIKSTSPFTDEKFVSTQYTTRQNFETTAAPNPNTIEDSVTETLLTVIPTESSTRETIAAVSQPRPFGFPRRTRPTTATSIVSDTTRSSVTGIETTTRPKVVDELILHHPASKNFTSHNSASEFLTEQLQKRKNANSNAYNKSENNAENISVIQKLLLIRPSNEQDIEKFVNVPVRFVDGPENEFFLLQIPENKLNISGVDSVLKIEVLKNNDYNLNVSDVDVSKKIDDFSILNKSHATFKLKPEIDQESNIVTFNPNYNKNMSKIQMYMNENQNLSQGKERIRFNISLSLDNSSPLEIVKDTNHTFAIMLNKNLTTTGIVYNIGQFDKDMIEKSAINNSKNVLITEKRPFINSLPNIQNIESLQNNQNSSDGRKIYRQRVLIYRGTTKFHPTNSSSQRRWVMKKVVRKRIKPMRVKITEDLETSATSPEVGVINSFIEVNTSRNPGLNLFRRPGDPLLPRGVYTAISSATLAPTTKIYPVQIGIDSTRVVGIVADQSGNPQNLELILADPPASLTSTTDSGRAALTRSNFRRKISTTISPRTTEETPASTSPRRVISSERRRQGQKYDFDRIASQNSYQIRSRPYKPAVTDYDYYEDEEERFVGKPNGKLLITSRGLIKCLDQGNFPHPSSCRKFITCAKMVNGIVGTEYTCPDKLSFDPIGGICNWSAGLGCSES